MAYACAFCNRHKGSDIGSIHRSTGRFVRFFNPRIELWANHFQLIGTIIKPLSKIGEVTAEILDFNHPDRVFERKLLIEMGRFPSNAALKIINKFGF